MTYSTELLAPSLYLYADVIDFSSDIVELASNDSRSWNIRNQAATDWNPGDKILGYDEYPISFSFLVDEKFLLLSKKIFDCVRDYANKNLATISGYENSTIRRYSSEPGFLELESADVENSSRKLVSILFLNNLDSGGELKFKNFNIEVSPRKGSLVIFPASFAYSFKINKPKDSDNFIAISYFV